MKFNEVKPFLMAGFKIDCAPFPEPDSWSYWKLKGDKFYRFINNTEYEEWGLKGIECSGDNWKVLDADPEKLTREQAIKLMDAGYKVTTEAIKAYEDGFYYKENGCIMFKNHNNHKGREQEYFNAHTYFQLYDNEPVLKLITDDLRLGDIISIRRPPQFIVTKEKPMNQSFAKIKPFVLAGFKFNCDKFFDDSFYQMRDNVFYYKEDFLSTMTLKDLENVHDNHNYYLLPNQCHHAKNLSYEQAKVLVEAGYRLKPNHTDGYFTKIGNSILEFNGKWHTERLGIPSLYTYELLDKLLTMETKEMTFDFKQAIELLKQGNKITHEEMLSCNLYLKLEDGCIVDKDGDNYEFSSEEILNIKWSLYEESPVKISGVGDNKNNIKLEQMSEHEISLGNASVRVLHNENVLVRFYKNGKIMVNKAFLEREGYKLEII